MEQKATKRNANGNTKASEVKSKKHSHLALSWPGKWKREKSKLAT